MQNNTAPRKPAYSPASMYKGPDMPTVECSALKEQVGGSHYKDYKIQPVEYIHANGIPYIEGAIIKYATRWRDKGGLDDLHKIIHFTKLLIELEGK